MSTTKGKNQKKQKSPSVPSTETAKEVATNNGENKSSAQGANTKPVLTKAGSFMKKGSNVIEQISSDFFQVDPFAKDLITGKKKTVNGLVM